MELPKDAMLLRIFFGENDKHQGKSLYEVIVLEARKQHMAGATVLRGPMGYGHSTRVHRSNFLEISEDLPIVIEIVDTLEKIDSFLPVLDDMMDGGLVTLEKVQVLTYGATDRARQKDTPVLIERLQKP
jgi:PII-like signaling protein